MVGCLGRGCPRQVDFVAFSRGVEIGDRLRQIEGRGQRDSGCAAADQGKQAERDGRNGFGAAQKEERIRRE